MSEASQQTQFKVGNSAWAARSTHGRKPIFDKAEALHSVCLEYFQWVDDNPLVVAEPVKFQGVGSLMAVPKMRAMTIRGLCCFLNINQSTWRDYRTQPDFSVVTEWVEDVIFQQKFEGAAAGMFNANVISRELGLWDRNNRACDEAKPVTSITYVEEDASLVEVMRELAKRLPD